MSDRLHFQNASGLWIPVSAANPLPITGGVGGGGGDASEATLQDILAQLLLQAVLTDAQPVVDGTAGGILTDILAVEGAINGAAVVGDTAGGTNNARLRGLGKQWADSVSGAAPLVVNFLELSKDNDEVATALRVCTKYEAILATTDATQAVAAPGAGNHLEVFRIGFQTRADGDQEVTWREGSGGSDQWGWGAALKWGGYSLQINGSWHLPENTALYVKCSTTISTRVMALVRTVADADRA